MSSPDVHVDLFSCPTPIPCIHLVCLSRANQVVHSCVNWAATGFRPWFFPLETPPCRAGKISSASQNCPTSRPSWGTLWAPSYRPAASATPPPSPAPASPPYLPPTAQVPLFNASPLYSLSCQCASFCCHRNCKGNARTAVREQANSRKNDVSK